MGRLWVDTGARVPSGLPSDAQQLAMAGTELRKIAEILRSKTVRGDLASRIDAQVDVVDVISERMA